MTVHTPLHGKRECASDLPPGDCADGEECLPSDYIDPDDCPECPPGCPDGQECLPSNYIDPDSCPIGLAPMGAPTDLPDLLLWFDADDAGTITIDGDSRVTGWADKSGNGNDLEVVGGADGPLYDGGTTLNQLPVVLCDEGSVRLSSVAPVAAPQPLTVFVVIEMGGTAPSLLFPSLYEFNGGLNLFRRDDSQLTMAVAGTSPDYPSMLFATGNRAAHIITVLNDDANGSSGWQDGELQFTGLDLGGDDGTGTFYLGNGSSARGLAGIDGGGYVAEFIAYSAALSNEQVALVEDYLRRKWFSLQEQPCAYTPYCFGNETKNSDVESVIIGLGPWAYYPMDDASGLIVDASGNGRDATSSFGGGTITYAQPGLTSKRAASIQFEGAAFVLPKPFQLDSGNDWCIIWLEHITAFHGSGSPSQASVLVGETTGGVGSPLVICNTAGGDLYNIWGKESGINSASYVQDADMVGRTCVLALSGIVQTQPRLYLDGVVVGAAQNGGLIGPSNLCIGASDDGFWGYAQHSISDFALFDRALTTAEIQSITQALHDADSLAAAVRFAT